MFSNNPFATHTLEILIILAGTFLIGLWMGWVLWGKIKEELNRLKVEIQSANVTIDALRSEIESLKTRAVLAETDSAQLNGQLAERDRQLAVLREKNTFLEQELSETQLRNRQLETELGLSFSPDTPLADDLPEEIKILVNEPAQTLPPENAAAEVELAVANIVEEEPAVANEPVAVEMPISPVVNIEPVALTESKPEKTTKAKPSPSKAASAAPSDDRDDLTVIEGIGPKIQMLLNQYGITTYHQLASAEVAKLKEILAEAGPQLAMHDPGTWPSQANLAANDQWDTLKSVQGFLKGGKKPD
jgi:predicted flap endonuclease-1-like 5' DNA nuclease